VAVTSSPWSFHDIKAQHRLLWGEEVFRELEINTHTCAFRPSMKPVASSAVTRVVSGVWWRPANVCGRSCSTPSRFLLLYAPLHPSARPGSLLTYAEVLEQFCAALSSTLFRDASAALRSGQVNRNGLLRLRLTSFAIIWQRCKTCQPHRSPAVRYLAAHDRLCKLF